jgi:hypothetical protein
MQDLRVEFLKHFLAGFCLDRLKEFISEEVLQSFRYVALEYQRNKKLRPGDVRISDEAPWVLVRQSVDLESLCSAFELHAWHKVDLKELKGKVLIKTKPTQLREDKKKALLVEQCIWRSVILSLMLERGGYTDFVNPPDQQIFFNLGYLYGLHHMDFSGEMNKVSSAMSPSHHAHMARARDSKSTSRLREDFIAWGKEKLANGDNPSNLEEMQKLTGYRNDWKKLNVDTQKKWARSAGFRFKAGRPSKK